jgi:chemotaxis protein MotB
MAKMDNEPGIEGAPEWITTFVDMISLLVTFFILLFTFSSIRDYDAFTFPKNILSTTGIWSNEGLKDLSAPDDDIMSSFDLERGSRTPHARSMSELLDSIEEMGQKLTDEHIEFDANRVEDGLRIRFDPRAGFAPGSTQVNAVLEKSLGELGRTVESYSNTIVIEGYTDSRFTPSPDFDSAEALSFARARAAADVLLSFSGVDPELIQIAGVGSRRPRSRGDSALERRRDRRVEVRIQALDRTRAKALEGGDG